MHFNIVRVDTVQNAAHGSGETVSSVTEKYSL